MIDLRAKREFLSLSQMAMATKAGVSLPTIGKLEDGSLNPTLSTMRRLADSYGVTIEEIGQACVSTAPDPEPASVPAEV